MLDLAAQQLKQGKAELALPPLSEHCTHHPRDAAGWFLLGACHHQLQHLPEALQAFERALAIEPRHIQSRLAKGVVLGALGHSQEALQVLRKALHLAPTDAQLLHNMAIVLEQTGDLGAALERYDQALKHHPDLPTAWLNRGALLLRLGRLQESLDNNQRLAAAQPNWEHALFNLGESLLALGQWQDAFAAYTRAQALQPSMAKAHFGCGLALSMLQRFDEAQRAFTTAQSLDPAAYAQSLHDAAALSGGEMHEFSPQAIYLLKEAQLLNVCDWSRWHKFTSTFEELIAHPQGNQQLCERALLFHTFALPLRPASRFQLACNIASRITERVDKLALPASTRPAEHSGKIRIGYVSPDFRKHPVASLSRRLYALHDRSQFEVYGYSLHPGDGSALRRDIEQGCDVFRELSTLDDRAAAEIIRRDGIDIIIDLAGYTTFSRSEIFVMRPAPLQLCFLGFLHSTGADFIDYFIADPVVVQPAAEQFFSEKIARLPDSYFLFDNQQPIAPVTPKREAMGLPTEGMVFCCHNNNYKITPDVFDSWMRILQRLPGSVLWLLKSSDAARNNLRREAELRGIAAQRLVFADFVPNDIHLARYRLADLFLDTFQCNAGTTAAEALWAGLPVLTCQGDTMAARIASSLLSAISLSELITTTPQQYEEQAVHLATHPEELARVRDLLARNRQSAPLFNTERQVQKIEQIYQHVWQRHQAGLPPETFQIKG